MTGDGQEDAAVVLGTERGGNAGGTDVFIYTVSDNRPVLLWKFAAGDRADGGLKKIHAENGRLVVELYGIGTRVGQLQSSEDVGSCCPKHYTRTKYKWDGKQFQQNGKEETTPIP